MEFSYRDPNETGVVDGRYGKSSLRMKAKALIMAPLLGAEELVRRLKMGECRGKESLRGQ